MDRTNCYVLHYTQVPSSATSSLLAQNIFLSTLLSITLIAFPVFEVTVKRYDVSYYTSLYFSSYVNIGLEVYEIEV
jgi:hypothetical protein